MSDTSGETAAIILAAGQGSRAKERPDELAKQWRLLGEKPAFLHAVEAFSSFAKTLVLTVPRADLPQAQALCPQAICTLGGEERRISVRNALEALASLPHPPSKVLIHDGARPLVSARVIAAVCAALEGERGAPAAAPALPVSDALWRAEGEKVISLVAREGMWRAQTPQGFHFPAILAAHRAYDALEDAGEPSASAADDVAIALHAGLEVRIVEGDEDNLKLTYPRDFARAEALLQARGSASKDANPT